MDLMGLLAGLGRIDAAGLEKEIRDGCRDTRDALARIEALARRQVALLEQIAANTKGKSDAE